MSSFHNVCGGKCCFVDAPRPDRRLTRVCLASKVLQAADALRNNFYENAMWQVLICSQFLMPHGRESLVTLQGRPS